MRDVGTPRGWYVSNSTEASLPEARRMRSPPGWRDAKSVMSRTRCACCLLLEWDGSVAGVEWTAHHADLGVLCWASSDLEMVRCSCCCWGFEVDLSCAVDAGRLPLHILVYCCCRRRFSGCVRRRRFTQPTADDHVATKWSTGVLHLSFIVHYYSTFL